MFLNPAFPRFRGYVAKEDLYPAGRYPQTELYQLICSSLQRVSWVYKKGSLDVGSLAKYLIHTLCMILPQSTSVEDTVRKPQIGQRTRPSAWEKNARDVVTNRNHDTHGTHPKSPRTSRKKKQEAYVCILPAHAPGWRFKHITTNSLAARSCLTLHPVPLHQRQHATLMSALADSAR